MNILDVGRDDVGTSTPIKPRVSSEMMTSSVDTQRLIPYHRLLSLRSESYALATNEYDQLSFSLRSFPPLKIQ